MNENKKRFVDQLLAADPSSSSARQHYDKEMRTMFEKTLTRGERRGYLFGAVAMGLMGLSIALVWGLNAIFEWPPGNVAMAPDLKFLQVIFLLTALPLLGVAAISFRAYWSGIVSLRKSNDWTAVTAAGYTGLLGGLLLLTARHIPETLRDEVRVFGFVLLVFAAVSWVRQCVVRAEMKTAEKLLEIELRVVEIAETLEAKPKPTDPASGQQPPPG